MLLRISCLPSRDGSSCVWFRTPTEISVLMRLRNVPGLLLRASCSLRPLSSSRSPDRYTKRLYPKGEVPADTGVLHHNIATNNRYDDMASPFWNAATEHTINYNYNRIQPRGKDKAGDEIKIGKTFAHKFDERRSLACGQAWTQPALFRLGWVYPALQIQLPVLESTRFAVASQVRQTTWLCSTAQVTQNSLEGQSWQVPMS